GAGSCAQLMPGRPFVLGLGVSSETIVDAWGGVPYRRPLTRMRETVAVLRRMLAGERVTVEGKTVRSRGFRLVSPPPAPVPVYVGALMPPMHELAGEIADGVILNFMPVDAVPRMLAHVRAGAARAGRDPATLEVVARFQTVVTDDAPAARDAIRQMMGPYFATSVYNRFIAWCGFPEEARAIDTAWRTKDRARNVAAVTDEMVDRLAIIGSAEHCRARLAGFAAADLGQFRALNPRLEVPTLVDGDTAVFDSTVILEYIEDRWPTPPLLPAPPAERARVRMLEDVCDTYYEAINWACFEINVFK